MKNLTLSLGRLAVIVAGALSLGACSRSEYAFQPKGASYLGSTPVARQRAVAAPAPAIAATGSAVVTAPAPAAPAVSVAPEAPIAAQPASAAAAPAASVAEASQAIAPAAKATATPKPNLAQRLALRKITKKLDKLASQALQFKKHDATASTSRISGNLRTGLVLLLVGLIVSIFSNLIGTIIALIGLVFIVLWLLDEL